MKTQEPFVEMLRGNANSLGRALEVLAAVKKDPKRADELFELYFQDDEWVKLRVSNVFRRLWREDKSWVEPYVERWVSEVAKIDQPSVQWTFAQLTGECRSKLSDKQQQAAIKQVKTYLTESDDWIVLNASLATLGDYAKTDDPIKKWLVPQLEKLQKHPKKSVAGRAKKIAANL